MPLTHRYLVVAAWEPELERFRTLGSGGVDGGEHLRAEAVGIGLVDAAIGMSRGIVRHIPTHVLLLGTCGASPSSGLDLGDVIVGTSVKLVDSAVVEGRAAMPFASDALPLDDTMVGALVAAGAKRAKIANTVGITTDDALATKLAEQGHVEHLEAYGVARACQAASVGCTIVLGIANAVGSRGRAEWRANHVSASGRAAEVAWSALESVRRSTTTHSPA